MSDIFISYKREDQATARKLVDALESKGLTVWWDPKLRAGERFNDVIEKALKESKCVVVMWSKRAVDSQYVKDEATYALNRNKLVPVRIEEVELPFKFEGLHTLSLLGWDGSKDFLELRRLVDDISAILGPSYAATSRAGKPLRMDAEKPEEDDLPFIGRQSSTVFFSERFGKSFPRVRGIQWFKEPEVVIERLKVFFAKPFVFRDSHPIWWWRDGDMPIRSFAILSSDTVLIDEQELVIDDFAAVNARAYHQSFLYLKTKPSDPSGLHNDASIHDQVASQGYAKEEFAIFRGRFILRTEYDDGAAVIDGKVVDLPGEATLRVRYLTPYNLIIAPHESPINNDDFEQRRVQFLNGLLQGQTTLEELTDAILKLPKRQFY
jgi:TIR domain